jgi:hypothetical protein
MGWLKSMYEVLTSKELDTYLCCDNPIITTVNDKTYCQNCGTEYK